MSARSTALQLKSLARQKLHPDGLVVRAIRYGLALIFVLLAIAKLSGLNAYTRLLEPLELQLAAVWATALFQLLAALMLSFQLTFALGAAFILLYNGVLAWLYFMTTASMFPGILLSAVLAGILVWAEFSDEAYS